MGLHLLIVFICDSSAIYFLDQLLIKSAQNASSYSQMSCFV